MVIGDELHSNGYSFLFEIPFFSSPLVENRRGSDDAKATVVSWGASCSWKIRLLSVVMVVVELALFAFYNLSCMVDQRKTENKHFSFGVFYFASLSAIAVSVSCCPCSVFLCHFFSSCLIN